jgi:hypothetical protein
VVVDRVSSEPISRAERLRSLISREDTGKTCVRSPVADVKGLEVARNSASPLWGCEKSEQGIAGNRRELPSAGTFIGVKGGFVANRDLVT